MKKILLAMVVTTGIVITGCQDNSRRKLQPEIAACDSAVVMYYHTPGNPRFFSMAKVYDKGIISIFDEDVNKKVVTPKDTCTTEGKIYFYGQNGTVYVVYFSRLSDCLTLSFIKTGEKYFTVMSKSAKEQLDKLQQVAKEPVSQNY